MIYMHNTILVHCYYLWWGNQKAKTDGIQNVQHGTSTLDQPNWDQSFNSSVILASGKLQMKTKNLVQRHCTYFLKYVFGSFEGTPFIFSWKYNLCSFIYGSIHKNSNVFKMFKKIKTVCLVEPVKAPYIFSRNVHIQQALIFDG